MLPNRQEFLARIRSLAERESALNPIRVLVCFFYFIPAFAYLWFHVAYVQERFTEGWRIVSAGVLILLLCLPTYVLARRFFRWHERLVRELELLCPSCARQFSGVLGSIAVASGRCGNCGAQVHIGDDPAPSVAVPAKLQDGGPG